MMEKAKRAKATLFITRQILKLYNKEQDSLLIMNELLPVLAKILSFFFCLFLSKSIKCEKYNLLTICSSIFSNDIEQRHRKTVTVMRMTWIAT